MRTLRGVHTLSLSLSPHSFLTEADNVEKKLALIRNGFGAAVMPPEVKRLALSCAAKINDGHMGPRFVPSRPPHSETQFVEVAVGVVTDVGRIEYRKFWRLYLPRLQYHNPNLTIVVERRATLGGPATLTVEFGMPHPLPLSLQVADSDQQTRGRKPSIANTCTRTIS